MKLKCKLKKYEERRNKIKKTKAITNYSDDYDKKYRRIKFNSNDDLPLMKWL